MAMLREHIGQVIKLVAPGIGNLVGGPVGGAFGAFVGAAVEELVEGAIEGLGRRLAGLEGSGLITDELRKTFAHPIETGLSSVVLTIKIDHKSEIDRLDTISQNWLINKLDSFCNIETWEKINRYVPKEFNTFEEYYFEPIRKFLFEGKPDSVPNELLETIADELARNSLERIIEVLRKSEDERIAVFNTIAAIYAKTYKGEMADVAKIYRLIDVRLKEEQGRLAEWVLGQVEILVQNYDKRLDKIEFQVEELTERVKTVEERIRGLEIRVARLEEAQRRIETPSKLVLGKAVGLPEIDLETAVERSELTRKLKDALAQGGTSAVVGLHGLAGVGKSFSVAMFIKKRLEQLKNERFTDGIAWVTASDGDTANSLAYKALSAFFEPAPPKVEDTVSALKGLLSRHKILVVFDGVEVVEPEEVERLVFDPGESAVVFTTRDSRPFSNIRLIDVDVMELDESLELFANVPGKDTVERQRDDFERLAETLGRLPLAMSVMAGRMKEDRWSVKDALERFKKLKTEMLKEYGGAEGKEANVEISFMLSFRELDEFDREVMFGLSVFSNKGARTELLAPVLGIEPDNYERMDELELTLSKLMRLSLLRQSEPKYKSVKGMFWNMHTLIRMFTKKQIESERLNELENRFVDVMLKKAREWDGEAKKTVEEGFDPEAMKSALEHGLEESENMFEAVETAGRLGRYDDALNLATYGGLLLEAGGSFDDALQFLTAAKEMTEEYLGKEHPATAMTYDNLGNAYADNGEYERAVEFHKKALEIRLKVLGYEHPDTASTYNNLGNAYAYKGEYERAIEFYKKALEIRLKVLGYEHPATAMTYNNLGAAYDEKGDYERAIEFYQKALTVFERRLGRCHPYTMTVLRSLAFAYFKIDKVDKLVNILLRFSECGEKFSP